ncbi:uncharacterized protein LOC122886439 [Siniperca chuatsi]|uniref:uncharacterized protein LOC122886439 n=1 Tax=Siniperca chuatsi TaxID=119488 RepID=UPI001CE1BD99|nr:uncharacterized protein LOC122886439 [Siniperca chuatsi]
MILQGEMRLTLKLGMLASPQVESFGTTLWRREDDHWQTDDELDDLDWYRGVDHRRAPVSLWDFADTNATRHPALEAEQMLCKCLLLWGSFVGSLGNKWWGSVPEEEIESALSDPRVDIGAIAIAAYRGPLPVGLCSLTMKTLHAILGCSVITLEGVNRCSDFVQHAFSDDDMLAELIDKVKNGYLISLQTGDPGLVECHGA